MERKEAFKDFLISCGFYEEVEGRKLVKYIPEMHADDEVFHYACWYIEENEYWWGEDRVSYNKFRTLLSDHLNLSRRSTVYQVDEDDLFALLGALGDKISHDCGVKYHIPSILLDTRLERWKKYNDLLKNNGADHFEDGMYEYLSKLIQIKKDRNIVVSGKVR